MRGRIVTVGEALIDLIQREDGSYEAKPGGAPANVCSALARLGAPVSFAGRMSTDKFGEKLYTWISSENVDMSLVVRTADPTSLAVASFDDQGKASYSFYLKGTADWGWTIGAFIDLETEPPAALVIGSVAAAIEPGATVIENLARHLSEANDSTVAIDLNIRPSLGFEHDSEVRRIERQINFAHIIKGSDDDLLWLYPHASPDDTATKWAQGGRYVIVTRGADGATIFFPSGDSLSVSAPVINLVDTVGAGDSFLGATLYGLNKLDALGANPSERLTQVSREKWENLLALAARVAAVTCSRAGCNPPTAAELGL